MTRTSERRSRANRGSASHPGRSGRKHPAAATPRPAPSGASDVDGFVLLCASVLIGVSIVMSYSATAPLHMSSSIPPLFLEHLVALALGGAAAAIGLRAPLRILRLAALPAWAFGVTLLVLTSLFGVEVNGAQRWLEVPGIGLRFQPVEFAKCASLVAVAAIVAERSGRDQLPARRSLFGLALGVIPAALLLAQPDLGNAVVLMSLVVVLLVIAGTRLSLLAVPSALGVAGIGLYIAMNQYAYDRVLGFLDPFAESQGRSYQLVQSFVAFSEGGLFGVGVGNGHQKLWFLPEGHTDFILALIAEELGLMGVLVVLGAFAGLVVAGTGIARRARSRFTLLIAVAMTSLLTVPALVNSAVVMGLVPTKGLTLPFLSHGGTSLVMCCGVLGLLVGIGRKDATGDGVRDATPRRLAWR